MHHFVYPKTSLKLPDSVPLGGEWIATEKIHGAHFIIATRGDEVYFGKRKAWLDDESPFFGWQLIRDQLQRAILLIARHYPDQEIRLFGELYGGHYPHPEVTAVPGLSAVQTGIWYAPDLQFAPFDLLTHNGTRYESFTTLEERCAESGLTLPPVLGRGKLSEVRSLPVRFPSQVYAQHDLPALEENDAEGFVIKPSASATWGERASAKHKIPEFDELRFSEALSFDPSRPMSLDELAHVGSHMINPARVASARSKLGQVSLDALIEEVTLDVLIDLSEVYPSAMRALDEAQLIELLRAQAVRAASNPLN